LAAQTSGCLTAWLPTHAVGQAKFPFFHDLYTMHPQSQSAIDTFIDALWLEDGLSRNTLAAYRRDLSLYAVWLNSKEQQHRALDNSDEDAIKAYFALRHAVTKATSANRCLTVFKRYFRWALRENLVALDPTLKLASAKQALRVPKMMSEPQVEALLSAPDDDTPLGLRDRAMLETMYASGLRVSELVGLKTFHVGLNEGVLRVLGKGSTERLVPFGQVAREWIVRYIAESRPAILGGQQTRPRHEPGDVLEAGEKICTTGRHPFAAVAAYVAPCLRHALAEPRRRLARRADAARPCRHFHHHDLHPCGARAPEGDSCGASSARLNGTGSVASRVHEFTVEGIGRLRTPNGLVPK
jgi:site-specific recombinase XerD